ncbi:hypothetical protein MIND_00151000 [Mycena indigotica]|uniref:Uncharacterized protein n=1 Tax=Mycena indigotica TaxID=2126181 RepID=A0A8H6WG08_9AGAR|nr:uncharacterized protein MIND_00151000 [Mycena indigotica]KAF7316322.1 hypothetical protein MIND_00151000 [Mycena indigotica]
MSLRQSWSDTLSMDDDAQPWCMIDWRRLHRECLTVLDEPEAPVSSRSRLPTSSRVPSLVDLLLDNWPVHFPQRQINEIPQHLLQQFRYATARKLFGRDKELDEWLQQHHRYLTTVEDDELQAKMLTLSSIPAIFNCVRVQSETSSYAVYSPSGDIRVLDQFRPNHRTIFNNANALRTRIADITEHALEGLDWTHIAMGGCTLLAAYCDAVGPYWVRDWDGDRIELIIHGIELESVPDVMQHIYDCYVDNISGVVRAYQGFKYITIISNDGPTIRIAQQLFPSAAHWAIAQSIDILGLYWDDTDLYMTAARRAGAGNIVKSILNAADTRCARIVFS